MLTFEEIDMLKHALTQEYAQLAYHNTDTCYRYAFMEMTEKLAQALDVDEHLIDDVDYSGDWNLYQKEKRFTEN